MTKLKLDTIKRTDKNQLEKITNKDDFDILMSSGKKKQKDNKDIYEEKRNSSRRKILSKGKFK